MQCLPWGTKCTFSEWGTHWICLGELEENLVTHCSIEKSPPTPARRRQAKPSYAKLEFFTSVHESLWKLRNRIKKNDWLQSVSFMSHGVREHPYFSQFRKDIASDWTSPQLPDTGHSTCSWVAPPSSHSPHVPLPVHSVSCNMFARSWFKHSSKYVAFVELKKVCGG